MAKVYVSLCFSCHNNIHRFTPIFLFKSLSSSSVLFCANLLVFCKRFSLTSWETERLTNTHTNQLPCILFWGCLFLFFVCNHAQIEQHICEKLLTTKRWNLIFMLHRIHLSRVNESQNTSDIYFYYLFASFIHEYHSYTLWIHLETFEYKET